MMLKRKDGSSSKRGLWDNIRKKAAENKAAGKAGKEPTNEMLKQDAKIKNNMKAKPNSKSSPKKMGGGYKAPQYQMGGDMLEPSKEIMFGNPPMMEGGGETPSKSRSEKIDNRAENKMTAAKKSWTKGEQARIDSEANPGTTGNLERYSSRMFNKAARQEDRAKDLKAKAARRKEVEGIKKYGGVKKK
jgi:hypothetical protein